MPDKTHILVISQYFYPEQFRINDICSEWVKRGHKVTVVTGIPNYPNGDYYEGYGLFKKREERYNGMDIVRLPLIPRKNGAIMMALNYISFVVSGFFWSRFTSLRADRVFIYEVSPMTQALLGVWFSIRRKIPCYIYVTDLWPENVEIAGGIHNKSILNMIGKMADYIYDNCDRVFVSSKSFIKAIGARGVPLNKLEFWPQYAEEFYLPIAKELCAVDEIPDDGCFNIIFAGNIGTAQGLDMLPDVALELRRQNKNVRFNIVGDGRYLNALKEAVDSRGINEMFNFIKRQPAQRIPEFMAVCDAALISLADNEIFAMTLPAKLQSSLACGIPLIVSANGEIQHVVEDSGAGVYCDAGDPVLLSKIIVEMLSFSSENMIQMRENARKYFLINYEKGMLIERIDTCFLECEV
ncbi:MAG: glycosyltransferase family 4 protein [Bacteroidales bacterium]